MKTRILAVTAMLALLAGAVPLRAQTGAAPAAGDAMRVPDAAQFVGDPKGTPLTGAALSKRTHEVASLVRCPVCQGMSVADSPSEMAVNMKEQVRELLARGYTEEQILKYFELSYGQFVLLKPKFEGVTGMVWILPIIALLVGGAILFFKLRKLEGGAAPPEETPVAGTPEADDAYMARVRDLVSGGKP